MNKEIQKLLQEQSDCLTEKTFLSDGATSYAFYNSRGDGNMTVYPVFPGIELIYHSVHTDRCPFKAERKKNMIEIHHCREGRMEQQHNDEFFYLMPGDLSVSERKHPFSQYSFPLHHYHGISILINTDVAPKCFSCFLEDVNVEPAQVARRLCKDKAYFVIRSQNYIEHIFSELYSVPESYKKGYFKIKIMELFLVLSGIEPSENSIPSLPLSQSQVELAKKIAAHLSKRMDQHITVADLSKEFHVSQTYLQSSFKGVYGVPIYSYMRILKMQTAALQLTHTERSVLAIANSCGYDNASKFASAFREIMGEPPAEYRKMHKITRD